MSYYLSPESRRCRRCKRKRLDDEPPEVRQYKTCAKCRIIERQKKKLKKPLAEETMAYGLKQLQEQHPGGWDEDFFSREDLFEDNRPKTRTSKEPQSHSSLVATAAAAVSASNGAAGDIYLMYGYEVDPSYQYEQQQQQQLQHVQQQQQLYHQHQQHVYNQTNGDFSTPAPSTPDLASNIVYNSQSSANGNRAAVTSRGVSNGHSNNNSNSNNINNNVNYNNNGNNNSSYAAATCDVCDTESSSSLCSECFADPYRNAHVYSDFTKFLQEISPEKNFEADKLTFIKEVVAATDFNENLDTNNSNPANERQYRELVLNSIKQIYLNPVIAATGFKFNRVSSNLASSVANSSSVDPITGKYSHRGSTPIKAIYKCKLGEEISGIIPNIELILTYNLITNVIVIKLVRDGAELKMISEVKLKKKEENERLLQQLGEQSVTGLSESAEFAPAAASEQKYPLKFINLCDRILKTLILENKQPQFQLGYNEISGGLIFDVLKHRKEEYPEDIQLLIGSFREPNEFIIEFLKFGEIVGNKVVIDGGVKVDQGKVEGSSEPVAEAVVAETGIERATETVLETGNEPETVQDKIVAPEERVQEEAVAGIEASETESAPANEHTSEFAPELAPETSHKSELLVASDDQVQAQAQVQAQSQFQPPTQVRTQEGNEVQGINSATPVDAASTLRDTPTVNVDPVLGM